MNETMWKKLMTLGSQDVVDQLRLIYGNFLPMEVRYHLADWIENTMLAIISTPADNPEYELKIRQFKCDFIAQMMQKAEQMSQDYMIPTRTHFNEAIKHFQYMTASNLYSKMAEILSQEYQLLGEVQNGNYAVYVSGSKEVDEKIENLKGNSSLFQCNEIEKWTKSFLDYQEEFYMITGNSSPLVNGNGMGGPSSPIEYNLHTSSLNYLLEVLKKMQPLIYERLSSMTAQCEELLKTIVDDFIAQWKYNQQIYGNNDFNINGANIKKMGIWCSDLGKVIGNLYDITNKVHDDVKCLSSRNDEFGKNLISQGQILLNLLVKLIRESLIIENQPPQVIKTNTRFTASIRLLIGDAINNKIVSGNVRATIVSEVEARKLKNSFTEKTCSDVANNQADLEFKDGTLVSNFKSMLLKNFKRINKKSCEMVTDEKCGMVFTVSIAIHGTQIKEKILSLPIVVIVHGSQEINAQATILWDSAFARTKRQYFDITDAINWKDFADALSYKYQSVVGRGLTDENLHYIAEKKLLRERLPYPVPQDYYVTWANFCKEKLPDKEFTFWEWFTACLKLTKDHLKNAWIEERIVGFIDKKRAEQQLLQSTHGTFMLRFSDTALGALSIAWLNAQEMDENMQTIRKVMHIQPIDYKGFDVIKIDQRIHDVEQLTYLYPNIPKHIAFRIDRNVGSPGNYVPFMTVMWVDTKKK